MRILLAALALLAPVGALAGEAPILNKETCAAAGGAWLDRVRLCVFSYADGGKACSDDADCQGKCLVPDIAIPPPEGRETGVCAKDSNLLGCKAEILGGMRQPVICRD